MPSRAPRPPARGPRASRLAGDGRSPSRPRDPSPGLETEARAAEDDAPLPPASRRSSASMRLRFAEALPSGSGAPPPIADVSPSAADQAATTVTRPKALRPPKRALAGVRAAVAASISSLFRRARERSAGCRRHTSACRQEFHVSLAVRNFEPLAASPFVIAGSAPWGSGNARKHERRSRYHGGCRQVAGCGAGRRYGHRHGTSRTCRTRRVIFGSSGRTRNNATHFRRS